MGRLKSNYLTTLTGFVIFITVLVTLLNLSKWDDPNGVITGDVRGYYAYLPALFIHNDLKLENPGVYNQDKSTQIWFSEAEDGTRFIKFTSGMSILYSPFFAAAHLYAKNSQFEANGFTTPYKVALTLSGLFYLLISLIFCTKFLRLYFSSGVTALTLLILFIGTNLFHYLTGNITYSHGYSFALISIFMYATVKWISIPSLKWAITIGVSSGLMVLIRPIDFLFIFFIPIAHIVTSDDLKQRFQLLWKKKTHVILMLVFAFLMILPQLLYFNYISGHFLFYSYDDESFFFLQPRLVDAAFNYRNGWLVYSPLMFFSVMGIFIHTYKKPFSMYVVGIFALYVYVIVSWWCWWYVGFGNRAFINLYPLLAIPLAGFITRLSSTPRFIKFSFGLIVLLGILLNIKQNKQFDKGAIHWDSMTKAAFWDSFGRDKPSQVYTALLEKPITSFGMKRENVVEATVVDVISMSYYSFNEPSDCDTIQSNFYQPSGGRNNSGGLRIPKGGIYSLQHELIPDENASHLYITTWVNNANDLHLVVDGMDDITYYHSASDIAITEGSWSKLQITIELPENLNHQSLRYYVWNPTGHEFYYDDFSITQTKHSIHQKKYD